MGYVEFLRVRNIFRVYGTVIAAIVVLGVIGTLWAIHYGHEATSGGHDVRISIGTANDDDAGSAHSKIADSLAAIHFSVPLGVLFGLAAYAAIIFATIVGPSLNKENCGYGFAFTKPISRERLAVEYIGIDVAAIVASFVYTVVLMLAGLACLGIFSKIVVDPTAGVIAACGLGAAVMWYGLLQALTSWHRHPGGIFIGLSWVYAIVIAPLAFALSIGTVFHPIGAVLGYVDPLAYFSGVTESSVDGVSMNSLLGLSPGLDVAMTWTIGVSACLIAALAWKRVEV